MEGSEKPGSACRPIAWLVEERPNPSSDYFVRPALDALGADVTRCGPDQIPPLDALADGIVLFVRYVPPLWARAIASMKVPPKRLIFFMDDDVLDWRASRGLPLRYRFKLARFGASRIGWLAQHGAELWVSTGYLQEKYAGWRPRLVPPTPLSPGPSSLRCFYHGTASHRAEIRWLRPVVEGALARDERLSFEIVGGDDVYRLYAGLSRVRVVHPMKWPAYGDFVDGGIRHIGLAPLLDGPFNRARSFTKFLDITRAGAAGIYSDGGACAEVVEHETDGLIVPLRAEAWIDAIVGLARAPERAASLAANAVRKAEWLAQEAQRAYRALR